MISRLGFAPVLLFVIIGCEKAELPFRYPLAIGNHWEYKRNIEHWNIPDGQVVEDIDTARYTFPVTANITGKTRLKGGKEAYVFESVEIEGPDIFKTTNFYGENDDGMYLYGYILGGNAAGLPKRMAVLNEGQKILFKRRYFNDFRQILAWLQHPLPALGKGLEDSIYYEVRPPEVLHYPLETDQSWTFRRGPWRIDKLVEGRVQLKAPAGSYRCHKIRWLYDLDGDGDWDDDIFIYDFIAPVGLVRREIVAEGIMTDEMGQPRGQTFWHETVSLEDVRIYD